FSPNNDGINDLLYLIGLLPENLISFTVYNRWGEIVFETNDILAAWDGKYDNEDVPMGVYAFTIQYINAGVIQIRSGNITLVR
ncbi:MAG: gliding motility-associated C-terminal domain-containing protein, partial [Fimbriimonadaceae bacterium]|nr:gliding motility-associated C-terminal domain-containing protein [Chitinophagales bacterium]